MAAADFLGGIVNMHKFGKEWEQTKVTTRLVVSYFNWMWEHSRFGTTAAQRAGLASDSWSWHDACYFSHTSLIHNSWHLGLGWLALTSNGIALELPSLQ